MAGAVISYADIYDIGLSVLQMRRPTLVVRPGDVSDAYLSAGATMANAVIGSGARGFRSVLLFGADGDDLHVVAHDRGVDWDSGDKAVGTVVLSRAGTGAAGLIPAGTRVASDPDAVTGQFATFTTNVDVTFLTTDLSKSVACTCTEIDKIGNVSAAAVTRILDTIVLTGITVTNPVRFAGGTPAEADDDLKARTASFPLVLRRGTEDALIYAAKLAPGVKRASIVSVNSTSGVITMYVSDVDGNSNQALADAATSVINGPPAWRSAGDVISVIAADLFIQDIDYSLIVRAGVDVNALLARTDAAAINAIARLNPGEILYRSIISTAVENVDSRSIVSCVVNNPPADISPSQSQVIRAGNVTHA